MKHIDVISLAQKPALADPNATSKSGCKTLGSEFLKPCRSAIKRDGEYFVP